MANTSLEYQCETCKKWFPSSEWLKTHHRIYSGDKLHEDEKKDRVVEWLEIHTGEWNKKEDFFEVKDWIEKIDLHDPEYRNISTNFMQYGVDMRIFKDVDFNREHINEMVTDHNSKLDDLYTSKIWEKILNLRS